ncbi:uncharacterized protein J4E92_008352 [Alternaria infectoria]|uniref:uncharacterized protein n=1 Tax=Alternaria infectoria TaxID=45303 RepID=UPI00222102B6|nr:uncharacterized protein J4E92_008352 [Alternaria infectoria]KAI4920708.1 hypothetical protein J4E92_008352 [Alternaria infectoria]
MVKIFAIGVTGWVGNASARAIAAAHPDYEWTVLLRSQTKEESVKQFLPQGTRFVIGDFDSHDVISSAAATADIVINWGSSDYEPLTKSIIDGMKKNKSTCYLIHTSGCGILTGEVARTETYGQAATKVYDDWDNATDLLTLPPEAPHVNIDTMILALDRKAPHIKTMIVCPPIIYGMSHAKDTQERSAARQYVNSILDRGKGFAVGNGKAIVNTLHITDLANFFVKATEAAAQGGGAATWGGVNSYHFVESGEMVWGEFAQAISKAAFDRGLLDAPDVDYLSAEEAMKIDPISKIGYGSSARSKAVRAYKTLGWKPEMLGIYEDYLSNWRFKAGEPHLFM